eukprot:6947531-Pyramimonas_sp.AAC.2
MATATLTICMSSSPPLTAYSGLLGSLAYGAENLLRELRRARFITSDGCVWKSPRRARNGNVPNWARCERRVKAEKHRTPRRAERAWQWLQTPDAPTRERRTTGSA